jgi:hypothetical protein
LETISSTAPFKLDSYTPYGLWLKLYDEQGNDKDAGDGLMEIKNNRLVMNLLDSGG